MCNTFKILKQIKGVLDLPGVSTYAPICQNPYFKPGMMDAVTQALQGTWLCRGSAGDQGSTPGPGPFAGCHSPFLTLFPVTLFSYPVNKARKGQTKKKKGKKRKRSLGIGHR